ncbi:MAG: nuclear transport factor 2 family protein [Asgard group archaeon]|nr:nuclear transport factor 2 family protein [Asgard group archaeon]
MPQNQEVKAIKEAIMKYYHEGHVKHDYRYYENILHDEWKIFYLDDKGELQTADKKTYMSWYDPKDFSKNIPWETEFFYVDVTDNIASVKIRLETEKVRYIDYFNMMKIDGTWWMVHKISTWKKK